MGGSEGEVGGGEWEGVGGSEERVGGSEGEVGGREWDGVGGSEGEMGGSKGREGVVFSFVTPPHTHTQAQKTSLR